MNKVSFAAKEDKEILKVLFSQKLSFYDDNYLNYYFSNKYDDDYHYVLKDEAGSIIAYFTRTVSSIILGDKTLSISVLKNFIYRDRDALTELISEVEDHLNHQELITLIEDKDNIFELDTYSSSNIFTFISTDHLMSKNLHLEVCDNALEILKAYARFAKKFEGFEVRDLKYFENKIKENIATSSRYLLYKENNQVYGYAYIHNDEVMEIIYLKKNVIDEVLTVLFADYDSVKIRTSSFEMLNKAYKCELKTAINYKYQINDLDLFKKLYKKDNKEVNKLLSSNIYFL